MKIVIAYKNFAANRAISHIGLGVTALNIVTTLRSCGFAADVWPIVSATDLERRLHVSPPTHVVISAPWIQTADLMRICTTFPETRFAVNCHSNLGFLQADPNAMRLVREGLDMSRSHWNFNIAGNCSRLTRWVESAYGAPCLLLPNMYFLDNALPQSKRWHGGVLRIGAFGATRALKNLLTAAGAALQISTALGAHLEFWISSGRNEGAGPVVDAVRQMMDGVHHAKLIENPWQPWPRFRATIRHMHLLLQPSYTESFNIVTADGVAEGVPSVVSSAIDWAPDSWKADVDDAGDIARTGIRLLHSRFAARRGMTALKRHNSRALAAWLDFIKLSPSGLRRAA
jgi:hypothetical protein